MRPIFKPRGFTLIEAMVALTVAGLLMTGLTSLVIYALRCLRQFTAYNTVQQQTLQALQWVGEDLGASNTASMTLGTPDSCILGSPFDVRTNTDYKKHTFTGTDLAYRTWVCYFRNGAGELRRVEQTMGGLFPVGALPLGTRPTLAVFTAAGGRVVARHLSEFQVSSTTTAATVQLNFRVTLAVDSTHLTELRTSTQVRVRN